MNLQVNLLDSDIDEFGRDQCQNQKDLVFMMRHPKLYAIEDALWTAWLWLLYITICKTRGHDLVDYGYATPDSGCIDMACRRCHYSWPTHWLY